MKHNASADDSTLSIGESDEVNSLVDHNDAVLIGRHIAQVAGVVLPGLGTRVGVPLRAEVPTGTGTVSSGQVAVLVDVKTVDTVGLKAFQSSGNVDLVTHLLEPNLSEYARLRGDSLIGGLQNGHGGLPGRLVMIGEDRLQGEN